MAQADTHVCTTTCKHTCGEAGGQTQKGKPCPRPGGWGIKGMRPGTFGYCRQHDPGILALSTTEDDIDGDDLTVIQQSFVAAYCGVANGNATQAYQLANPGCTYSTAASSGSRMLKKDKIQLAIATRFKELSMGPDECLKRLTDIARLDMSSITAMRTYQVQPLQGKKGGTGPTVTVTKLGVALTKEQLEEGFGRLIKKFTVDGFGNLESVEFHDSHAALRDIARISKLYTDATPVNVNVTTNLYQGLTDEELLQRLRSVKSRMRPPRQSNPLEAVVVGGAPTNGHGLAGHASTEPLALPPAPAGNGNGATHP